MSPRLPRAKSAENITTDCVTASAIRARLAVFLRCPFDFLALFFSLYRQRYAAATTTSWIVLLRARNDPDAGSRAGDLDNAILERRACDPRETISRLCRAVTNNCTEFHRVHFIFIPDRHANFYLLTHQQGERRVRIKRSFADFAFSAAE